MLKYRKSAIEQAEGLRPVSEDTSRDVTSPSVLMMPRISCFVSLNGCLFSWFSSTNILQCHLQYFL